MYPRSRMAALVDQLTAEQAIRNLTTAAFKRWVPTAEAAVLPSLLADGAELPPDPNAITDTQQIWEAALDGILLYGTGLFWSWQFLTAYQALGGAVAPEPVPDFRTDTDPSAAEARRIVARSLGVTTPTITSFERRLAGLPSIRTLQSRYLADVRVRMVNTPETVFRAIAKDLDKALAQGESPQVMRDRVQQHLNLDTGDWPGRALTVARTESAGAMSGATVEAAQLRNVELGEDLEQTWIATLDSNTRKTHWSADGQRVPLGGKFKLGRIELRYPGDPRGPVEEVANCRCRVAILAKDEELPTERDRHTERGPGDSTVKNRAGTQADEIARREAEGNIRARDDEDGLGRVASAPSPATLASEEDPMTAPVDAPPELTEESGEQFRTFTDQVIAVIGTPTDDRRILAADIDFRFRTFPLPVMWQKQSEGGHFASYTVGVIEESRVDGAKVLASGYLLNSPEADEAADQSKHGVTAPSVDLGDTEWLMTNEAGEEITEDEWFDNPDLQVYETVTSAKLLGFTLVATPAFGETGFKLNEATEARPVTPDAAALVAAAGLITELETVYAPELFSDPQLSGPTYPSYDPKTGRIFGHLACFDVCHVGIQDRCVMAPKSQAGYSWFHTSPPVLLENGERAHVGRLTVGTGHADKRLRVAPAIDHYDNTGTCFALVHVGEDAHGIWFSGVAAPGTTVEQIRMGLSAPLSGDWRKIAGNYELVAALAVNTPGFPICASGATDESGDELSLVASLGPSKPTTAERLSERVMTQAQVIEFGKVFAAELRDAERRRNEALSILGERRRREVLALIAKVGR